MAAKLYKLYQCSVCGNIVQDLYAGGGTLVCCGKDMLELDEKTADKATEKHVPVVTKSSDGYDVVVGTTLHPMTEEHYIMWIELQINDQFVLRKYLKPGDEPKAHFSWSGEVKTIVAREHCNKHGQWKGSL